MELRLRSVKAQFCSKLKEKSYQVRISAYPSGGAYLPGTFLASQTNELAAN